MVIKKNQGGSKMTKHEKDGKFEFQGLFIFDMANNHQGSVEHGLRIINETADIVDRHKVKAAIKFQFRDRSLYHPDHLESSDNKHIPRFLSTYLKPDQYEILLKEIKKRNLISMCTPFDEESVNLIEKLNIDIVKVASCSAQDWPLLERIAKTGKPVICSTGGLTINEIDSIVSFFWKKDIHFALEYCVAIYPTPNEAFHLNQIGIMRNRYNGVTIGFSTHEQPDNLRVIGLAYAAGARTFEKHVGVATDKITLNSYSGNPKQVNDWIEAYKTAVSMLGNSGERDISDKEKKDLASLMRGVYVKNNIRQGSTINRSDIYFAMPLEDEQLVSGFWQEGLIADRNYQVNEPLNASSRKGKHNQADIVQSTVQAVRGMLNTARIPVSYDFSVELSHHYGLNRFHEVGCIIIEVINREYGKKLLIQLPGQRNPSHFHKKKEETFQVLFGKCWIEFEGKKKELGPGEILHMPRGVMHSFGTNEGVIFEEISTRSFAEDSYYEDKAIVEISRDKRKTYLHNWGKHQFD